MTPRTAVMLLCGALALWYGLTGKFDKATFFAVLALLNMEASDHGH